MENMHNKTLTVTQNTKYTLQIDINVYMYSGYHKIWGKKSKTWSDSSCRLMISDKNHRLN